MLAQVRRRGKTRLAITKTSRKKEKSIENIDFFAPIKCHGVH